MLSKVKSPLSFFTQLFFTNLKSVDSICLLHVSFFFTCQGPTGFVSILAQPRAILWVGMCYEGEMLVPPKVEKRSKTSGG